LGVLQTISISSIFDRNYFISESNSTEKDLRKIDILWPTMPDTQIYYLEIRKNKIVEKTIIFVGGVFSWSNL